MCARSVLAEEQAKSGKVLEAPMHEAQQRLKEAWRTLQVKEELCGAFRWSAGMPLDDALLAKCTGEAERLEAWVRIVKPMLNSAESAKVRVP